MENNNAMTELTNAVTDKGMKTVTTGQLVGLGAGCAAAGAGIGIGSFIGIRALWRKHKEKKAKKEAEKSKETKSEEKKEEKQA